MDFLILHSLIVKELKENDDNLTANMLLPLDKQDAVTDFMDYVDILADLMNEPNEGVWKLMLGCAPYNCLRYLNEREHNNLLFIIDYFLLPDSLKTRVSLSLTRDAYACFEDLSDFTEKDIQFWIIVGEKIGIDTVLSNAHTLRVRLEGLLLSSKIRNKFWFDYLIPTEHYGLTFMKQHLWTVPDSNLIQWILDDKFVRPLSIQVIICNYFVGLFHTEKDSVDIPEIVKSIMVLVEANKKLCEEINVKTVFVKALYAGNTTLLDYVYQEFHPNIAENEHDYFQMAIRGCEGSFVWLHKKYKPTIRIDDLKHTILQQMHREDVVYFHENIEPFTESEIIEGFENHIVSARQIPIFEMVKYFISLGFNLLHTNIVNHAILKHDCEVLKLFHKLGYKFTIYNLEYTLLAYDYYDFCEMAFLLVHKYMNYCEISKMSKKRLLHNDKWAKTYFKKCAKLRACIAGLCASL